MIQESIKIEKQIVTANDPLVALQYYEQMPYRENMYKPQLPDTLPWDHSVLVFPEETNLSMKEILDCIVWREDNEEEML